MSELTLVLIKPDGVKRGLIGNVISRIEAKGYAIVAIKMIQANTNLLKKHYAEHIDKPYFPDMVDYMTQTPVIALILKGDGVITGFRNIAGATSPNKAQAGTIRGDYGRLWPDGSIQNIVHSSDSVENASREIEIWFPEFEEKNV